MRDNKLHVRSDVFDDYQGRDPNGSYPKPKIVVEHDWDGFFEQVVRTWIKMKEDAGEAFTYSKIYVTGMPYQGDAVVMTKRKGEEGALTISFYPAIRNGFGSLSEAEVAKIIDLL